ncbi:MAG: helix-hairpin-helix domain-containing protein [Bacteroidales bacterium]|nr:helix-hairpin-helix domain-containing protein [Bacteroidales bacterium]
MNKDFFHFTQGEKRGVLLLMIFITIFITLYTGSLYFQPITRINTVHDTIYIKYSPSDNPKNKTKQKQKAKYASEIIVDLNTTDVTQLKKIPGIGPVLSERIINYRTLLGGYCSVKQLSEIRGINQKKYRQLKVWFKACPDNCKTIPINLASQETLSKHPYLNIEQVKFIMEYREKEEKIKDFQLLLSSGKFSQNDVKRLEPYLTFD